MEDNGLSPLFYVGHHKLKLLMSPLLLMLFLLFPFALPISEEGLRFCGCIAILTHPFGSFFGLFVCFTRQIFLHVIFLFFIIVFCSMGSCCGYGDSISWYLFHPLCGLVMKTLLKQYILFVALLCICCRKSNAVLASLYFVCVVLCRDIRL